ncbi:MAG: hypothetical protein M4579_001780 [Chaenotheca gracillima]|nr:MAG: hypothetical protein M4579_001780 [Chaenotheca gracillima]
MAPDPTPITTTLSPAELSYLHTSLTSTPAPTRPDGRSATQFRPLIAETDVLPGTNGSARVCFADGTEAVVGVKGEVERTATSSVAAEGLEMAGVELGRNGNGRDEWVELSVEIPGFREDDALPVFLGRMLTEAVTSSSSSSSIHDGLGERKGVLSRLRINDGWHWKIYIDILLLSLPLSYPLPLLSLTTHLALLSTKLPKLKSEGDEDPLFDDDWEQAEHLYPPPTAQDESQKSVSFQSETSHPPVTLLVMAVGPNVIFDPSREELAVADCVLAVSVVDDGASSGAIDAESGAKGSEGLRVVSVRTVDPPSRMTAPGVPLATTNASFAAGGGGGGTGGQAGAGEVDAGDGKGVWKAPRGGVKRDVLSRMVKMVVEDGEGWGRAVAREVLDGLEGVISR